ncbi:MAG TPA: hypothetical protein VGR31_05695 [Planctomycetota bacterium]|jgi:hypothetical protein|nr:hypothetical protein [Planctomycetota bacterium]
MQSMSVLVAALFALVGPSGGWEFVERSTVSPGPAICCEIACAPSGVVHVAYQDQSIGTDPATVVQWTGAAWELVGPRGGASIRQAWYDQLAFDGGGAPLLACRDYGIGGRLGVRRMDVASGIWRDVGAIGPSPGEAHYTDIATARDGSTYVVFADRTTTPIDRATVMRFSGGVWSLVGAPGISAAEAQYATIALDANDVPTIAFADRSHPDGSQIGRVSVMRYDGAAQAWSFVGPPGFTPTGGLNARLAFDRSGAPCLVYQEYHIALRVMRFDGAQWNAIGGSASGTDRPTVETEGWRQWLSLAFDSQNAPYVAYELLDLGRRASVRRFDGAQWSLVGAPGFTPPNADYLAMTVDAFDVPWIVFRDWSDGNRAAVMRYAPSPTSYCTASIDHLGCAPHIATRTGTIFAAGALNQGTGALFYGLRPGRVPFEGGVLCIAPRFHAIKLVRPEGSAAGFDCTGTLAFDFDAWVQSGADPTLVPGTTVFAQFWYRDPFLPAGAGLTDAIRFTIGL